MHEPASTDEMEMGDDILHLTRAEMDAELDSLVPFDEDEPDFNTVIDDNIERDFDLDIDFEWPYEDDLDTLFDDLDSDDRPGLTADDLVNEEWEGESIHLCEYI